MPSSTSTSKCYMCRKLLPTSLFIRNDQTNTFFKTCSTCRSRRNFQRQISRRQRPVAPPPPFAPTNDAGQIGSDDIADIISPQTNHMETETEYSHSVTENTNLEINSHNSLTTHNLIFCNVCKRSRGSEFFRGRAQGRIYKSCTDCRLRDFNRRHSHNFQDQTDIGSHLPGLDVTISFKYCAKCKKDCPIDSFTNTTCTTPFTTCHDCRSLQHSRRYPPLFESRDSNLTSFYLQGNNDDLYEVIDNEREHVGSRNINHTNEEVVGEEALVDDEPVIILSHADSREYANHMWAREALPEDHVDIFENLDINVFDYEVVGPFVEEDEMVENRTNLPIVEAHEDAQIDNMLVQEPTVVSNEDESTSMAAELTAPRRLPQWLTSLPTHRTVPAAYVSRYNRNLPTHNLGRCTSVCPACHALHWPQERVRASSEARPRFQTCCKEGQVVLNEVPEPPSYLRWLWTSEENDAKAFRSNVRSYNRAFAFTSFKYTAETRLADRGIRGGLQSFSIHGQVYHQTGAALREGAVPKYAQLYFVGATQAVEARTVGTNMNPEIVRRLTELIALNNPFVEHYHTALRSLQESEMEGSLRVVLNPDFRVVVEPHTDRRRYNLPTTSEVAVVIPDGADRNTRDVILFARNGDGTLSQRFEYIPRNHPAYLPLHYVLFYPFGNLGYHWSIPLQNQKVRGDIGQQEGEQEGGRQGCVSARQYFRYHLLNRRDSNATPNRFNALLHGDRLFQQICCDMYACVDDNILNWHRLNQSTVRSDLYSGVIDALQSDRADQIGDPVILAASNVGGDRFIARCYQSAMAIARALGNPSWSEIKAELEHHQTPDSRPDFIAKTFKLKLDATAHDLKERYVCGVSTGSVYTIEYQKRGLPHAHILLFLHRDVVPRCAEQVDEVFGVFSKKIIFSSLLSHQFHNLITK